MDRIALHGVRVEARHGANPGEREQAQIFEIDLVAEIDLTEPAASDDIESTLHYGRLYDRITTIVRERSYALLERLAFDLLSVVFADARVARAEVTISKPAFLDGATPSVTLARANPRHRAARGGPE
ncbi:MAG TPA: dihydroneopterin aldolase [Candidatus Tyrphobacter sp.]